jgi:hypothetical protein
MRDINHSLRYFLAAACISVLLAACAPMRPPSASRPTITPSTIYEHCMPIEVKLAIDAKQEDPKWFAHFICKYYAGTCKDEPDGESCQKALHSYSAREGGN